MNNEPIDGTLTLVLGIVGLAMTFVATGVGLVYGILAWGLGTKAIQQSNQVQSFGGPQRQNANIGRICGLIAALLSLGGFFLKAASHN